MTACSSVLRRLKFTHARALPYSYSCFLCNSRTFMSPGDGGNTDFDPVEMYEEISYSRSRWEILRDIGDAFGKLLSPVELQSSAMMHIHTVWQMPWGLTFMAFGALMRLLTLLPGLYVHRNAMRIAQIAPELSAISQKLTNAKANSKLSWEDKQIILKAYKKQKKHLYKKHNCSQMRSYVQIITLPFLSSAFLAIRNFAAYNEDLERSSFLWIRDLSMPDPYTLLPFMCGCVFLMNLELNRSLNRGSRSGTGIWVTWATRLGCFAGLIVGYNQPAAIFIYWLGMSLVGFVQPLLLRLESFRDYFDFPPFSDTIQKSKGDWLMNYLNAKNRGVSPSSKQSNMATIRDFDVVFPTKGNK